jgi:hypothetical protein
VLERVEGVSARVWGASAVKNIVRRFPLETEIMLNRSSSLVLFY